MRYVGYIFITALSVGSVVVMVVAQVVEVLSCIISMGVFRQVHSTQPLFVTRATKRFYTRMRNIRGTYKRLYAFYSVRVINLQKMIISFWKR